MSSVATRSRWTQKIPKVKAQSESKPVSLLSFVLRPQSSDSFQTAWGSSDSSGDDVASSDNQDEYDDEACALCRGTCRCGEPEDVGQPRPLNNNRRAVVFRGIPHLNPPHGMNRGFGRRCRIISSPVPGRNVNAAMAAEACVNRRTRVADKLTESDAGDKHKLTNQSDSYQS